jgi:hypothetical protein
MRELAFTEISAADSDQIEGIGQHLGPETDGEQVEPTNFWARVHEAPIPVSLNSVLTRARRTLDNPLYGRFDLWMVPHRFSILRNTGSGLVSSIGCLVEYYEPEVAQSIVSIFPSAEYVTTSPLSIDAKSKALGMLDQLGVSALIGMPTVDLVQADVKLTLPGVSLQIDIADTSHLRLSLDLVTPIVLATGVGSRKCSFQFNHWKEPLHGRDLETWALIAAHKRTRTLKYRMKVFYTIRSYFIPRRWETPWADLSGNCVSLESDLKLDGV